MIWVLNRADLTLCHLRVGDLPKIYRTTQVTRFQCHHKVNVLFFPASNLRWNRDLSGLHLDEYWIQVIGPPIVMVTQCFGPSFSGELD